MENKTNMQEHIYTMEGGTLPLLQFQALDEIPWLSHCFTTKKGGCSEGIFESLNLSFTRGDDADAVMENYKRVARAMNCDLKDIVTSDQTHTTNVRVVTKEDGGKGLIKQRDYQDVDGLVTNQQGLVLATFYADCVPLYFVDSKRKVIGLSHAGWRGTVGGIGKATIDKMKECFDSNPQDILCCVGPSICQNCYEIGEEVAQIFQREYKKESTKILTRKENGKFHLDLWEANKLVLKKAGVKESNIFIAGICTCCHKELLFSHRATQGKRGNLGAFLMIKSD